ncbi:MAG: hypothetical protein KAH34_03555 [Ketobacter sp.]|nr:hypothetical protein [Ketobacter sp.]MEC8809683.1 hypothetical protein [Pseudomonadota bacterium]
MQATLKQASTVPAPISDEQRLKNLRAQAESHPELAKENAWELLKELQNESQFYRLPWLFAQGNGDAEAPNGDTEGMVMNLHGSFLMRTINSAVMLGQLLGRMGWTGKTFNRKTGTGYNRITASAYIPTKLAMPHYKLQKQGNELLGFDFHHRIDSSPVAPHLKVRAITYDEPSFKNPLILPKVRDEIVEIVPDVFLGRVVYKVKHGWDIVGYFALRYPYVR